MPTAHNKKSGRVFLFGAGVSKAVAGAPVMNELFARMEERYEYEKKRSTVPRETIEYSGLREYKNL